MKSIKEYKYLYLKNDYFNHKKHTRKRNDIIYLKYSDGVEVCRIYLNNVPEFVEIQYDSLMISEISKITWTKDTKAESGIFVKSQANHICLNNILRRYGKDKIFKVKKLSDETINETEKSEKRKEFIKKNPNANKSNPD